MNNNRKKTSNVHRGKSEAKTLEKEIDDLIDREQTKRKIVNQLVKTTQPLTAKPEN